MKWKKNLHYRNNNPRDGQVHVVPREELSVGHWVPVPGGGQAQADATDDLDLPVQQWDIVSDRAAYIRELRATCLQRGEQLRHPWPGAGRRPPGVATHLCQCHQRSPLRVHKRRTARPHLRRPNPAGAPSCRPATNWPPAQPIAGKVGGSSVGWASQWVKRRWVPLAQDLRGQGRGRRKQNNEIHVFSSLQRLITTNRGFLWESVYFTYLFY